MPGCSSSGGFHLPLLPDAWMLPRFNILSIKTHGSSVDSFSYYLFSFLFHRAIVLATVYSIFAV
ncbi:hypothetical protein SEVIR_5G291401v4 [Setaria viridis]|uniref:Uncharacterized protein n=1 Tax=Setaria italica TaxID=4555 RepID=K3XTY8_SETIT